MKTTHLAMFVCVGAALVADLATPLGARAQDTVAETAGTNAPGTEGVDGSSSVDESAIAASPAGSVAPSPTASSPAIAPTAPATDTASSAPAETSALSPGQVRVVLEDVPGLGTLPTHPVAAGVPWTVSVGTQTFGQYELVFPAGADWNHRFAVPRMWLYTGFRLENVVGRVLVEGTRVIDDGALSGIADDSFLVRVREAWAGYRIVDLVELRAGLIPTLLTPLLGQRWGLRAVNRIGLREFDLLAPADLGASAFVDLPEGFGRVGASYTNGEGYSSRELNRGKNLELVADVHPLAFVSDLAPLVVTLAYTNGSLGAGSARSDRLIGGLAWSQRDLGVGASAAYVLGIADRGEREGVLLDAWARGLLFEHLLLGAQFLHFVRDLATGTDALSSLSLTVGARVYDQLRVYLAVDGRFADTLARASSPAWERWDVRLVVEADVVARFLGAL